MDTVIEQTSTKANTHTQKVTFVMRNSHLTKALKQLTGVVDHSQVIQVLSFLKCSLQHNSIHLVGSNSEIEMHTTIPLESEQATDTSHDFTMPCKKLFEIARSLPSNALIECTQEGAWTQLKVGRTVFKLASLSCESFPIMEKLPAHISFTIQENELLHLLKKTQFCMATNDVRFFLNGLLLETGSSLTTVATDGHRLSCQNSPQGIAKGDNAGKYIIPRKTIVELCKYLQDDERPLTLSFNSQQFSLKSDDIELHSCLIDGDYPAYKALIPNHHNYQAVVNVDLLKASLLRLAPLSNEKYHGAKLTFTENRLTICTQNLHQEEATDEIAIQMTPADSSVTLGFNMHYILDVLNSVETESVLISIVDEKRSITFEAIGDDQDGVYIIMPLDI